jgi:hypothetical protein
MEIYDILNKDDNKKTNKFNNTTNFSSSLNSNNNNNNNTNTNNNSNYNYNYNNNNNSNLFQEKMNSRVKNILRTLDQSKK